jgi:hypothetical protein
MIQPLRAGATSEEMRAKINELVAAQNLTAAALRRAELIAGTGLRITPTENGTRIDISGLTATGTCVDGGLEIVINGVG